MQTAIATLKALNVATISYGMIQAVVEDAMDNLSIQDAKAVAKEVAFTKVGSKKAAIEAVTRMFQTRKEAFERCESIQSCQMAM